MRLHAAVFGSGIGMLLGMVLVNIIPVPVWVPNVLLTYYSLTIVLLITSRIADTRKPLSKEESDNERKWLSTFPYPDVFFVWFLLGGIGIVFLAIVFLVRNLFYRH